MATLPDTRKYTTSRLPSNYGYDEHPVVDDTLPSRLPVLTQRTGRLIRLGRQLCELWSPNSAVHPYLPGLIPKGSDFSIPNNPRHRRYDGHLGRFDYTVVPQMFSDEKPWRGFILRPFSPQTANLPEFAPVHQLWKPSPLSLNIPPTQLPPLYINSLRARITDFNRISTDNDKIATDRIDVWRNRPELPTPAEIDRLAKINNYEDAVDLTVDVQRRIRDFDAWHRYVQLSLAEYPDGDTEKWLRRPLIPANDEWLGAWINGVEESDVLRSLIWKMPCFIAHILSPEQQGKVKANDLPSSSLTERTDVGMLHPLNNGYDYVARSSNRGFTSYVPMPRADPPSLYKKYRVLSASTEHGWTGRWHSEVVDSRELLKLWPPPPHPPLPGQVYSPDVPAPEALPLDTVDLDKERVPWIRPPPVKKYVNEGKLSHWIEETIDGKEGMKEVAKSKSLQMLSWVYDRDLKRKLYFDGELRCPPGAVFDDKVFGLPLPPLLFADKYGCKAARSTWVYRSEKPIPRDVDHVATTPEPSDLPLLTSISNFPPIMMPYDGEDDDYVLENDDLYYALPDFPHSFLSDPSRDRYVPPHFKLRM
jgi:hypothetical protein